MKQLIHLLNNVQCGETLWSAGSRLSSWYSVSQPFLLWQHFKCRFHVPQGRLPPTYITEEQHSTLWIQWKWVLCSLENWMKSEHVCVMIRPWGNDCVHMFQTPISQNKNQQLLSTSQRQTTLFSYPCYVNATTKAQVPMMLPSLIWQTDSVPTMCTGTPTQARNWTAEFSAPPHA